MTMSALALAAKRVIDAAWLHGAPYDLSSQAAFALESVCMLQSPETAEARAAGEDAVRVAEAAVVELRREHEENARLRAQVAELLAERHSTNEALDDAVQALREKEKREAVVAEFVAARAEYVTSLRNCHPDNGHDYDRWQGHAAARRQLAESLGLPVAWPAEDAASADGITRLTAPTQALQGVPDGEHYAVVHRSYRLGHDMPETGGAPC